MLRDDQLFESAGRAVRAFDFAGRVQAADDVNLVPRPLVRAEKLVDFIQVHLLALHAIEATFLAGAFENLDGQDLFRNVELVAAGLIASRLIAAAIGAGAIGAGPAGTAVAGNAGALVIALAAAGAAAAAAEVGQAEVNQHARDPGPEQARQRHAAFG